MIVARKHRSTSGRAYVDGQEPCLVGAADAPSAGSPIHPPQIFPSVPEVADQWVLDTDVIAWGPNAGDVLSIRDPAVIATGRGFAALVDPNSGLSRSEAVTRSIDRDQGSGVPYELQYALRPPGTSAPCWVEDIGRWFAGADGKPLRAHGVVRVINERHEREQRLPSFSPLHP